MGVKLKDIVVRKQIVFEDLAKKTIAVDFSNSAYQFLSSIRQPDGTPLMDTKGRITSHLVGTWSRFANVMQQQIKLVIVFDGKMPELKHAEHQDRWDRKEVAREKYDRAKEDEDPTLMAKYGKQFTHLSKEMIAESKQLIEAMGLPIIQAPAEADAQMAYLCKQNDVYACGSSDYDTLLHGAPRLLTNLTLSQKKKLPSGQIVKTYPEIIDLQATLTQLGITQEQLICIGILSGTDYNAEGIKGIGPKKGLKLVKQYKTPEKLFKELHAEFDWEEILDLFKKMDVTKNYQLTWKEPNPEKIKEILIEEHDFSEERVNATVEKLMKAKVEREQAGLDKWFK